MRTTPTAQLRENVKTPGSWVTLLSAGRPTHRSLGGGLRLFLWPILPQPGQQQPFRDGYDAIEHHCQQNTEQLVPGANAQAFASMNNSYLAQHGVNAVVTGITMDAGEDTVLVQVTANLDRLFPNVVPLFIVKESGYAQIKPFTH